MLQFLRKHQRYFFVVITVVIVISFSFFGTYSALPGNAQREQTVFTAIDGSAVSRSDLEELTLFLATDAEDKRQLGGMWGPNFLNDGVVKKDFLQTGLAEILVAAYAKEIEKDLTPRLQKEKRSTLYTHPQAQFLTVEGAWDYFAPDMPGNYQTLKHAMEGADKNAFAARVRLYLAEKRFPPSTLRQVLRYQEKQYSWITPDPALDHTDLSLFGYHSLDDWFGPRFLRLVAQFVINSSKIAEKKGYHVSKEEAWADLSRNAELSFQQLKSNPNLGVANVREYMQEELRRLGLDSASATKLWQQVMLFRRLFQGGGSAEFVDPFLFHSFTAYAKEGVSGDSYKIPKPLWLNDFRALQLFETYLAAVSSPDKKNPLALPATFFSPEEVAKKTPELVQKKYVLEISEIDAHLLQTQVTVKDTWNWELEDNNWSTLKKQFPDLGVSKAATREARFASLEALDTVTRSKVDAFARNAIAASHPEWITDALRREEPLKQEIGIALKGETAPFSGLKNPAELIALLDLAPLGIDEANVSKERQSAEDKLRDFSPDGRHHFSIRVIARAKEEALLTFAEAKDRGILALLLDKNLAAAYEKIKAVPNAKYQKDDKSWKPLEEVRSDIEQQVFAKTLKAIQEDYLKLNPDDKKDLSTNHTLASLRFYGHVKKIEDKLIKDPEAASEWIQNKNAAANQDLLIKTAPLADQWKLERSDFTVERDSSSLSFPDIPSLFALKTGDWTPVFAQPNGELSFFHRLEGKSNALVSSLVAEKIQKARKLLSYDLQQKLMQVVLKELQTKNALSLDYLEKEHNTED